MVSSDSITEEKTNPEKLSYEEVIDEFGTFVFAGTETTGHLIAMVLYYLTKYPHIQQKLYE